MKHNKGFTLVEMLVSMVLLTMVMLIASGAYSLFSDRWNGRLGHYNKSMATAKESILVQEALNSIIAYAVTDDKGDAKLYFEGNRNGFVAVTLRSIYNPKVAAVIRLKVSQNDDFTYKLIYEEFAMTEELLINAQQPIVFSSPIVLFDKLVNINFQYFGWPSLASYNWSSENSSTITNPKPRKWFDNYNALDTYIQPEQIKVTFSAEKGEFSLQTKLTNTTPYLLSSYSEQL